MKKTTITILSLLIAGFAFSEEQKTQPLVIGKILPKREKADSGEKKPAPDKVRLGKPMHKPFPPHWGKPPAIQTKDLRPLPAGFGKGSSTLARWILEHIKEDKDRPVKPERPKRPEPSAEVKEKLRQVHEKQREMYDMRQKLRTALRGELLVVADRNELIDNFRKASKEKLQSLKEAQKELLKEVRSKNQSGARRE